MHLTIPLRQGGQFRQGGQLAEGQKCEEVQDLMQLATPSARQLELAEWVKFFEK